MPFDFTVAFQNGESYLLHMKDGSWVLADREIARKRGRCGMMEAWTRTRRLGRNP